jgi:hypothetical protein
LGTLRYWAGYTEGRERGKERHFLEVEYTISRKEKQKYLTL